MRPKCSRWVAVDLLDACAEAQGRKARREGAAAGREEGMLDEEERVMADADAIIFSLGDQSPPAALALVRVPTQRISSCSLWEACERDGGHRERTVRFQARERERERRRE